MPANQSNPRRRCVFPVWLALLYGCSPQPPNVVDPKAQNHIGKADILLGEGDVMAAVTEAAEAARLAPDSAETQAFYGRLLRQAGALLRAGKDDRSGYYRRAREALERALAIAPKHEHARIELALLLQDSDRSQEAVATLEPVAVEGHPEARFHLASILAGLGQTDRAVGIYRAGLSEAPSNERARVALAMILSQIGRLEEARDELLVVVRANPTSAEAFLQLGLVLGKLEVNEASLVALARATDLDPRNQQAQYNLALAMRRLGFERNASLPERRFANLKAAARREQELGERLAAKPDDFDLRAELGAAYIDGGDWTRARSAARNVLERSPHHPRARAVLARVLQHLGAIAEARAELDGILARNADDVEALALRGRLHLAEGKVDAARADLERALELDPDDGQLREDLGRLALAVGRPDVALALVQPGLPLEPPHPALFKIAAEAMFRLGDHAEAVKTFSVCLPWQPADVEVLTRLAEVSAAQGDVRNARRLQQRLAFVLRGELPPP